MGLPELLLALLICTGGLVVLVPVGIAVRRRVSTEPATRAPLSLIPLAMALLLAVVVAPAVGLGLGGLATQQLLLPAVAGSGDLVVSSVIDPWIARLWGSVMLTPWLALPGLLAAAWMLGSRARSWKQAVVLGGLAWLGYAAGLAVGRGLLLPTATAALLSAIPSAATPMLDLADTAAMAARAMLLLGMAGACAPVVAMVSGSSRQALVWTLVATAMMPGAALAFAALTTPPDLLSQLLAATVLGLSWLLGLAAGALRVQLRAS